MPTYEFKCLECGKEFSATIPVSQLDKGAVTCPGCGKGNPKQLPTVFISKTSRKS